MTKSIYHQHLSWEELLEVKPKSVNKTHLSKLRNILGITELGSREGSYTPYIQIQHLARKGQIGSRINIRKEVEKA